MIERTLNIFETHIGAWIENGPSDFHDTKADARAVLSRLRARGFRMLKDTTYRSLDNWDGRLGDLEVRLEGSGRVVKLEFFQNLNVENRNGGRYDFQKFERMPRSMQYRCVIEMTAIARFLMERGYVHDRSGHSHAFLLDESREPLARTMLRLCRRELPSDPLERFNDQWDSVWETRRGEHRFKRGADGWPVPRECTTDRSDPGVPAGSLRYFRHRGRLMRAPIYPTMNGGCTAYLGGEQWWGTYSEVFACEHPEREARRLVPKQRERLQKEVAKSVELKDYRRVERLARAIVTLES